MRKDFDAIIIGAGNGGLSTATKLAIEGKKVLLMEKHNIPGGCGTSFRRGQFEFEVALHQLSQLGTVENPGELREIFNEYGIMDDLEFVKIDSLYKVVTSDGFEIALPTSREGCEQTLIEKFPDEKEAILKYYDIVFKFNDETVKLMSGMSGAPSKEPGAFKKFLASKLFPKKYPVLAKYMFKTTDDVLDELGMSNDLRLAVNIYWCFMGMPPERFPFSILARCTALYITDYPYYIKGGSQMMSQALVEAIKGHGGTVMFNNAAEKIIVENGKAVGVTDSLGNTYSCDYVVSGISLIDTYFKLIDEKDRPAEVVDYFKPYTVGISALTCFIGLDCTPEEIGFTDSFNLIYEETDCNEAFKNSKRIVPDKDPLVTTCYTIDDPAVSPEGTTVITAGTLKYGRPWMDIPADEYYKTKYEMADIIVNRLEKKFPGIRSHIEEMEVATPLTHMRYLNTPEGAIYGFEQDVNSTIMFFPNEDFIENLTSSNGWVNTCGFGPNYIYGYKVAKRILAKEGK